MCSLVGQALALGARPRGFDPCRTDQYASVAQSREQRFCKPKVAGSIPAAGTRKNNKINALQ